MALSLNTSIPWVMCKQIDAPDPIMNTYEDFYCDYFKPNSPENPKMWKMVNKISENMFMFYA
jgi:hypothetical protein